MKVQTGLRLVSIGGYMGCVWMSIMGYPPLAGVSSPLTQALMFTIIIVALFFSPKYPPLAFVLTFVYGIAAMLAFSGVIQWVNYSGTTGIGPFMMLWDIALGVAIATEGRRTMLDFISEA